MPLPPLSLSLSLSFFFFFFFFFFWRGGGGGWLQQTKIIVCEILNDTITFIYSNRHARKAKQGIRGVVGNTLASHLCVL